MDEVAISFAEAKGITTISLHSILRSVWESGILTKEEVKNTYETFAKAAAVKNEIQSVH